MTAYYEHGGVKIYHGDCREILPALCSYDLLLADPPFGLGASRRKFGGHGVKQHRTGLLKGKCLPKRDYGDEDWDDAPADAETLRMAIDKTDRQIIWGGNYFDLGPARCYLIWDKLRGNTDFADCEMAWTNLDRAVRIIRWKWNGFLQQNSGNAAEPRYHPTQKPFSVMTWALSQVRPPAASVLDPWLGSGTTLIAAKAAGIAATGIEINERYCEIAARRLSQEVFNFTEEFTQCL